MTLSKQPLCSRAVHFELSSASPQATRDFFTRVLGWSVQEWPGAEDYWFVSGDQDVPGIDGAIAPAAAGASGTVVIFEVQSASNVCAVAAENGAVITTPPQPIPGVGVIAYFTEPGGVLVGIIERERN